MSVDYLPIKRKPRSVSSFLRKTYQILQDEENSYAIRWAQTGIGFVVVREEQFSKEVLPKYFKHSNYSSFVRQLNMYNFHKVRQANYESHFHHDCFRKNNKLLLSDIKRKPEKKKQKIQDGSEDQIDQYNDKSDVSMKNKIKQYHNSISNFGSKVQSEDNIIKSYKSPCRKTLQNTRHIFVSQKQNKESLPSVTEHFRSDNYESKVSIQNILSGSIQIEQDKLSINNELGDNFPRYPTKQIFSPSNNNIYPVPVNVKVGAISHFSILF